MSTSNVLIIIPTYDERDNVQPVADAVLQQVPDAHILFVDDNSPDGTADVVRGFQAANPRVHLLVREQKQGLGAAYVAGITEALERLEPDAIVEMDADLSHHPRYLLEMIAKLNEGYDFVIGSRYVAGGSIPAHWGFKRVFLSSAANAYTRVMLGLYAIKDCSGGYRAIRASYLRSINLNKLTVSGYSFQAVILEAVVHAGGSVVEIPIHFSDREEGASKMSARDVLEWGRVLFVLRMRRIGEEMRGGR